MKEIEEELGPFSLKERLECRGTAPLSAWTWAAEKLGLFQQPRLLRVAHRC